MIEGEEPTIGTVKHQDEIIGRLTREVENLREAEIARQMWIRKAKQDAGFDSYTSFDDVWKLCLQAYLASRLKKEGR